MKKKSQDTSIINTGQGDIPDKDKNLATINSQIHSDNIEQDSIKNIGEHSKSVLETITAEPSPIKQTNVVTNEKRNAANGNNQKVGQLQPKSKTASDSSTIDKVQDADNTSNKSTILKSDMNKKPDVNKTNANEEIFYPVNNEVSKDVSSSLNAAPTSNREKDDLQNFEPVSLGPSQLPDSSAVPSFASAAKMKDSNGKLLNYIICSSGLNGVFSR